MSGLAHAYEKHRQALIMHKDDIGAPYDDEQPVVPQTPAVRLTRRQLAKLEGEEALNKSQRAPPTSEDDTIEERVDHTEEQAVEVTEDESAAAAAPQDETPIAQGKPPIIGPESAPKPTRRTRRQQTKHEQEHPSTTSSENVSTTVTEEVDTAVEAGHAIEDDVHTQVEPETAPEPKRLTRRRQAKLEEEEQQSQVEEQKPRQEPRQEPVEGVAPEAQVEAVVGQEDTSVDNVEHLSSEPLKAAISTPAAEEHFKPEYELGAEKRQVEGEAEPESSEELREVNQQVSEMAEVTDNLDDMAEVRPATPTDAEFEVDFGAHVEDPTVDKITPSVDVMPRAEPKMLCDEKPFEISVSTPIKDQDSIRRTSRSPTKSPMCIEESISAIDRLEEDLESIGTAIPDLSQSEDEKSLQKSTKATTLPATREKTPGKTPAKTSTRAPARTPGKTVSNTPSKTPAKAPVATKASLASKVPAAAKASLPTRVSRAPSAAPKSVKPTTTSLGRASSVRTAPNKDTRKPSAEAADYLASKRRPISLSFPTPPPPPKGRAPTKPTFQLSSETVAAKLKAQKEERLKREAEGAAAPKQRPISMPPPPKSTKPPTVPSFQLPGEATAAKLKAQKEERLKRMEEAGGTEKPNTRPISMPIPPRSTKPVTKPSFQLPGEATAARLKAQKEERLKRMEEAEAAKKAALAAPVRKPIAHRPRQSLFVKDAPGVSIPPPTQADAAHRSTSLASKRSSIVGASASRSTSTSSANRNSVLLAEGGKSTVTPVDTATLKIKGKQVFNRDRLEKEAMERERREKEEAAKRARAEAAERGRIASREWAERQRKKMMGQ